jgi:hypothetical protein
MSDWLLQLWKEIAILVTGASAVIGLLTETQDPTTKRVTVWGKSILSLILLSTVCGILAQHLEDERDGQKTRVLIENTQSSVEHTEQAVLGVSRLLTQIVDPTFDIYMNVDCNSSPPNFVCSEADVLYKEYQAARRTKKANVQLKRGAFWLNVDNVDGALPRYELDSRDISGFVLSPDALSGIARSNDDDGLLLSGQFVILLFRAENAPPKPAPDTLPSMSDATYAFGPRAAAKRGELMRVVYFVSEGRRRLYYIFKHLHPDSRYVKPQAVSFNDFDGGTLLLGAVSVPMDIKPERIVIESPNGVSRLFNKFSPFQRVRDSAFVQSEFIHTSH